MGQGAAYEGKLEEAAKVIEQGLPIANRVNEKKLTSRLNSNASIVEVHWVTSSLRFGTSW